MKSTLRAWLVVLALAVPAGSAWGAGVSLAFKGGYFFPSDAVFKETYGNGPVFGADISVRLSGGLAVWAGADYFGKTGALTVSEEETKVKIIPVFLGLRYRFGKSIVQPYVGAAAAFFLFEESNVLGSVSENGLGFLGQGGVLIAIGGRFAVDIFANYRACTLRTEDPEPLEANIGGLTAGGGLVIRF